jgi:hypothetical protein
MSADFIVPQYVNPRVDPTVTKHDVGLCSWIVTSLRPSMMTRWAPMREVRISSSPSSKAARSTMLS